MRLDAANGLRNYWWNYDLVRDATPVQLLDGNWHHVAATFDGQTRSLWLDGNLLGSDSPGSPNVQPLNFTIGKTVGNEFFSGFLDDVRIYNRSLNSASLLQLAQPSSPAIRPDLIVSSVSAPATAVMGQAIQLVYTLSNAGGTNVFGPWFNEVRVATNSAGAGAQFIGNQNFVSEIPAGGSTVVTQSVILPAGVFGTRYLGVVVDSSNVILESNETNNTRFASTSINISAADLVGGNLGAPASAQFGQTISINYSVTNNGNASAASVGYDQIFLGTNGNSLAGATLLKTVSGAALNSGSVYSRTQTVVLPLISGLPSWKLFSHRGGGCRQRPTGIERKQ